MGIQIQGYGGVVADVWGTGFRALKTHVMPHEHGSNGHYKKSLISGTMAAGLTANSNIWQLRWTHATKFCVVNQIVLDGVGGGTAFTAGFGNFRLFVSRSWTVDGSGGTSGTLTGDNGKARTSMATTLMGAIRISSTAALTAGTKTNDTDSISSYTHSFAAAGNGQLIGTVLFGAYQGANVADGHHPIVLAQNEGLTMTATVPATGTWQFGITVHWAEVDAY
jgi:hypothetical protein